MQGSSKQWSKGNLPQFTPHSVALLVIDMQNDFCHERGALSSFGEDMGSVQQIASALGSALEVARQNKVAIFHIRTIHHPETESNAWKRLHSGKVCRPGTWGAEPYLPIETMDALENEALVKKSHYNAFDSTDLCDLLVGNGVETIVLTGTSTNACVLATAFDGLAKGFNVVVFPDCVASPDADLHEAALQIIRQHIGFVLASDEFSNLLESSIEL